MEDKNVLGYGLSLVFWVRGFPLTHALGSLTCRPILLNDHVNASGPE